MTINLKQLKPCPFCGCAPQLKYGKIYLTDTVQVICPNCKVRTQQIKYNCNYLYYHGRHNFFMTDIDAHQAVAMLWNTRSQKC